MTARCVCEAGYGRELWRLGGAFDLQLRNWGIDLVCLHFVFGEAEAEFQCSCFLLHIRYVSGQPGESSYLPKLLSPHNSSTGIVRLSDHSAVRVI
jgi:hypothetical protein